MAVALKARPQADPDEETADLGLQIVEHPSEDAVEGIVPAAHGVESEE